MIPYLVCIPQTSSQPSSNVFITLLPSIYTVFRLLKASSHDRVPLNSLVVGVDKEMARIKEAPIWQGPEYFVAYQGGWQ